MPWCPSTPGEFPTLGWAALDWMTTYLTVPDGVTRGDPLVFTPEQAAFVLRLYEIDPTWPYFGAQGLRVLKNARKVKTGVLSRPRGWGKSPLVAALCLWEACGEPVPDGWDADGQPVGRTWDSVGTPPYVQIVAVSEDQTINTWRPLRDMVLNSPVAEAFDLEYFKSMITVPGGLIEWVTSSGDARTGFRPVFYACDQTETWKHANQGVALMDRLTENVGKVGGCMVQTPNAFIPGEDSVAETTYHGYVAQLENKTRNVDGLFYDHREMPPDTDWTDRESMLTGLSYVYGDSADTNGGWVDLDRILYECWRPDRDLQESARMYGNQILAAVDAWITGPEWKACEDAEKVVAPGERITMGFDGSRSNVRGVTDATALVGCRVSDGHLFPIGVWEQPSGPAGKEWRVPVEQVDKAVEDAFEVYDVVGFYADPAKFEGYVAKWEAKYNHLLKVRSTEARPIEWWFTGSRLTLVVRSLELIHSAIIERELTHDGSWVLMRHFLAARRRPTTKGITIMKEHPSSDKKIDAAVAGTLAYLARNDAITRGLAEPVIEAGYVRW